MVDWSKPVEWNDGTPTKVLSVGVNIVILTKPNKSGLVTVWKDSGQHSRFLPSINFIRNIKD